MKTLENKIREVLPRLKELSNGAFVYRPHWNMFSQKFEEGVGKLIYNKGKDKSPKFYFYKDYHRNNKFTTLPI